MFRYVKSGAAVVCRSCQTLDVSKDHMPDSDLIAYASVLVTILVAISAYRSARSAEKANQINLHTHQKAIHDAFFELKMHVTQKAEFSQLQEVSKFYYPAKDAKFYFDKPLAKDIEKYFDLCFDIADLARVHKTDAERDKVYELLRSEIVLSKSVEERLNKKLAIA